MRDSRNQIAEVDDFLALPLSTQQRDKARRVVCACAAGSTLNDQVADAEDLMRYLGIHPSQDEDAAIGAPYDQPSWY